MDYNSRLRRLRAQLPTRRFDLLLITHLPNIRYLCGFTGSAGVLAIAPRGGWLFTDSRYREQARAEVSAVRLVVGRGAALTSAAEWISRRFAQHLAHDADAAGPLPRIGLEGQQITLATQAGLRQHLPKRIRLLDASTLVEELRLIKELEELVLIRAAVQLGDDLFEVACRAIRPGVREVEVAAEIEYHARRRGADGMSFPTIVASGERSALPHGVASPAPIPRRGFVVLDFGVILAGYCSDMTRTVHVGKISPQHRRWYLAVQQAQQAGVDAVRAGVKADTVDQAARTVLRQHKLDQFFTHSTGHGVGLEIHEMPRIASAQTARLRAGMVITIEPGIYIAGQGGIRIEDMVAVTESGCNVLTASSKDLIEL